ncbi:MAG: hypothetical protein WBP48_07635, partial [Microbacterium sp.]
MSDPTRRSGRAAIADAPRAKRKRPLLRSFRFWVPVGILIVVVGIGIAGWLVADRLKDEAFAARDDLRQAIPLATTVKDQILTGDTAGAQATAARLSELTADARAHTDGDLWRFAEGVP